MEVCLNMQLKAETDDFFCSTSLHRFLSELYSDDFNVLNNQTFRYRALTEKFIQRFPELEKEMYCFSTPGRSEIGGNHTDHNNGKVLAAAVNLDSIAIAAKTDDMIVVVYSIGYEKPFIVDLENLQPIVEETGSTFSLIRGIAAGIVKRGFKIGGLRVYITSDVLRGSGLSSSASIEVLLGNIFNQLYNNGAIDPTTLALIGQYAENEFFGKPCGLMDQLACAFGGFVSIDFKETQNPKVEKIEFDFSSYGYKLLVVDTKGDHADLTDEYASIPNEMKDVANALQAEVCRDFSLETLLDNVSRLRNLTGDRAILRAMHFHSENSRVEQQACALGKADLDRFLSLVEASGSSSWKWLQNCYSVKSSKEQGLALALAITEDFISKKGEGACRVHGGGFAGTIQVFLPSLYETEYIKLMDSIFGDKSVTSLSVRSTGSKHIKLS